VRTMTAVEACAGADIEHDSGRQRKDRCNQTLDSKQPNSDSFHACATDLVARAADVICISGAWLPKQVEELMFLTWLRATSRVRG
jgi:hypothetical protein